MLEYRIGAALGEQWWPTEEDKYHLGADLAHKAQGELRWEDGAATNRVLFVERLLLYLGAGAALAMGCRESALVLMRPGIARITEEEEGPALDWRAQFVATGGGAIPGAAAIAPG